MDPQLREILESLQTGQKNILQSLKDLDERLAAAEESLKTTAEIATVFQQFGAMVESNQEAGVPLLQQQ